MKILKKIQRRFFPTRFDKSIRLWFKDRGDKTHRLNYLNLDNQSIVFDVGGYMGDFASDIFSRYLCKIFLFEPVKEYYEFAQNRFINNNSITILPYGAGINNSTIDISKAGASSSLYKSKGNSYYETVTIKNIIEIFEELKISNIDLMKINIEGGEYELLDLLIDSGWVQRISNIQIQFHIFVNNSVEKRKNLQKKLSKTHTKTYDYYFVWENWKKK